MAAREVVVLEGPLRKLGHARGKFHDRYLVLKPGGRLLYYHSRPPTGTSYEGPEAKLVREYSLSKTAVVSDVKDQSKGSLFVFAITWDGADNDDHDTSEVDTTSNNTNNNNARISSPGNTSSSSSGGVARTVRISSSDALSSDADSRAVSPSGGSAGGQVMTPVRVPKRSVSESDKLARDRRVRAAKIAATATGGVVIGVLTAGVGLLAGALVAGTAAAGTGAAAAYQHAKNKEQRVLVLATETYGVAVAWQRALAQEIRTAAQSALSTSDQPTTPLQGHHQQQQQLQQGNNFSNPYDESAADANGGVRPLTAEEILAGPPAPPGTPAFAVWANGAAQAAIAGGLRTPTSRANQTHQSHVLRPPGSPPPSGVTNSPRLSGHSSSSSASSGNDGSNNRTSDNGSSSSSSMGALNLDAEALEMELDGAGQGGRDGWSNLGAWALSESTWQKSSRGCRRAVGSGISSALGTSSVESYFPPTAYSAAGAAAAVAATGSSTACDNIDMPTSPPPPPPIDPLLCPPLRVKSVVGAPTLGAFVATMGQPTDGAISSARVVKTINAHTDVLHLVLRPSLTSSANSGNSSNSSSNSSNTWFPSHAGSGGGSSVAGAAAASAVHASPYMGGSESAGRSMVAQKATRVTQVLLLLLGSWLIADLASTVAHAAVLLAPPLPDTLFLDLLDRIFPESSSFDAPTASTAAAARTAAAAATAFLQLVTSTLGLAATVPAESADKVFGSSEVAVSQAGLTSSSGGGGGGTPGAVVTSALWPWLQTIGTSGWLLLQRGRALINMLLESCCASTPRAALAITILAALLFALLLAPLPLSNDDDSDVEAGSGLEAYVVRRWWVDPSNGAYVIALDSMDSALSRGGNEKGTTTRNLDSRTCRLHAVLTLQPLVPRHHRGHTPNPFRFRPGGGRSAGGGGAFGILAGLLPDDDDSLQTLPSLLPPSGPDGGAQAYSQQPFASPLYTSTSSAGTGHATTTTAAGVSFDNNAYGGSNSDGSFNSGPSSASSNNARKDDGNSNNSSSSSSSNSGSTNGNGKGTRSLSFGDSPNLSSQPAPLSSYGRNNGRENASAGTSGSSSTNNNNINNTSGSGNIASPGMMENTPLPMPPPLQQRSSSGGGNSSHHHHSSSNSSHNNNAKLYAEELARQVAMAEAKGAEMLAVEASQCLLTLAVQVEHPGDAKSQRNKALTSSSAKQKKGHSKSGATSPAAAALPTGRQEALASTLLSFALDVRDAAEGQRFQPLVLEDQRNLGILTSG